MTSLRFVSFPAVVLVSAGASAQTPGFWLVGLPQGASSSGVGGLSADGSVAAGVSQINSLMPGFRWTAGGGREDFGLEPGMPSWTPAQAISRDASTIVGYMDNPSTRRAYRRVGDSPLQDLGPLGSFLYSVAYGVSGDGSVVVGIGYTPYYQWGYSTGQAFRWTQQGGMQSLGVLPTIGPPISAATAISRDGSTIVGVNGQYDLRALVWRPSTGIQELPPLAGSTSPQSGAGAVNLDGSIIGGWATGSDGQRHMVRWTASGPEDLGLGIANAISDDGSVLAGDGGLVWTPATGSLMLTDYLAQHGVQVPAGWSLPYIRAISGDGLTFAGSAFSPAGVSEGFVATIPAFCYPNSDQSTAAPILNVNDFVCFLNRFAAADTYANCDGSTAPPTLNVLDFTCYLNQYAAGCP